ncbi:MAG TPA: hypothetical protein VME92_19485 [Acetobacteraceae bacterium]|nr:hypothetical protein [Acetobacteraceae bacterium]
MSEPGDDGPNRRLAIVGLIVVAALIAGGLWLTGVLRGAATVQDCLAAGRTNCAPIAAPGR